jgi:hypothetical protein
MKNGFLMKRLEDIRYWPHFILMKWRIQLAKEVKNDDEPDDVLTASDQVRETIKEVLPEENKSIRRKDPYHPYEKTTTI